ncbi:phosphotransferase [Streptomyces sulfonofaciens]|uniref:Phosphotransferase n=1 Tax=Streptomyces sulfonofaciens TaxID=68272 RepID=A0A919FW82_9ACTN|nr:aminoglycoside phosphotransferase family protein [Streptomyces sulfonofaciens]GHH73094.1 phosphotransferase [Streptomyces sulfonofaciens]
MTMTATMTKQLAAALAAAGVPVERVRDTRELSGSTYDYNDVTGVTLDDGRQLVLKVPPHENRPGLAYERDLLRAEAMFCRAAHEAEGAVPVPRVEAVHTDAVAGAGPFLLMTALPGTRWPEAREHFLEGEQEALRHDLGNLVARLHTVVGDGFGYPSGALGPLAGTWREAFSRMVDAVVDDARRFGARLPRPAEEMAGVLRRAYPVLDEVVVPRLVHFDLWEGNVLVDGGPRGPRIGGLVDGERMFWGDPLADFASGALLGEIEGDPYFLDGYRQEAGGFVVFDEATRLRIALYRCYLYLIMLVEQGPRGASAAERRWARREVVPSLTAAMATVAALS